MSTRVSPHPEARFACSVSGAARSAAAVILALILAAACSDTPTEVESDFLPAFANCAKNPSHPHCNPDPPPPPPPPQGDQVDLDISFRDGDGSDPLPIEDGLAGDALGVYVEGVDGVGSHLSGANGNLMFDVDQYASGPRSVWINVSGSSLSFNEALITRIYTNNSSADLRDMLDGDDTARFFVEWKAGRDSYDLRFGTDCSGDKFRADSQHDVPSTRVNINRSENTYTVTPLGGAYLCKLAKGNKPPVQDPLATVAFEMTMVRTD